MYQSSKNVSRYMIWEYDFHNIFTAQIQRNLRIFLKILNNPIFEQNHYFSLLVNELYRFFVKARSITYLSRFPKGTAMAGFSRKNIFAEIKNRVTLLVVPGVK